MTEVAIALPEDLFISYVDERIRHLAANPLIGRPRRDLAPDLRSFIVRQLILFYFPVYGGIQIVRILHSSRDIKPDMFGG